MFVPHDTNLQISRVVAVARNQLKIDFSADHYCDDYNGVDELRAAVSNKDLFAFKENGTGTVVPITAATPSAYQCDGSKVRTMLDLGNDLAVGDYVLSFKGVSTHSGDYKVRQQEVNFKITSNLGSVVCLILFEYYPGIVSCTS
jgi:hypothetical protein